MDNGVDICVIRDCSEIIFAQYFALLCMLFVFETSFFQNIVLYLYISCIFSFETTVNRRED